MDDIGFQCCIGTKKSIQKIQFFFIILLFFISPFVFILFGFFLPFLPLSLFPVIIYI
jgi:hypothetical protein